jgi:hypothetical protein
MFLPPPSPRRRAGEVIVAPGAGHAAASSERSLPEPASRRRGERESRSGIRLANGYNRSDANCQTHQIFIEGARPCQPNGSLGAGVSWPHHLASGRTRRRALAASRGPARIRTPRVRPRPSPAGSRSSGSRASEGHRRARFGSTLELIVVQAAIGASMLPPPSLRRRAAIAHPSRRRPRGGERKC